MRPTGTRTSRGSITSRATSRGSSGGSASGAWVTSQLSRNVFEVRIPYKQDRDWEWLCLLTADRHWDNPKSDRERQLLHLDEAKAKNAAIIDAGDWFCAMQGKYDKRSGKSAVRPEHQVDNYLDALVNTASEWFEPYAHHFVCIAMGNHEGSIYERMETNLTERFVALLNARSGASVYNGGFSGFVWFKFVPEGKAKEMQSLCLHYDHGYGGGGAVTKDMIQHNRRSTYLPDAHIVVSGHTHDQWTATHVRKRCSTQGRVYHDQQKHIKIPSYKESYGDGFGGWEATRGFPPKPTGAWWIRFYWNRRTRAVETQVIEAE
jgi:hypothetical protein